MNEGTLFLQPDTPGPSRPWEVQLLKRGLSFSGHGWPRGIQPWNRGFSFLGLGPQA